MRINDERFLSDMEAQGKIGATGDGGVSRPALFEACMELRDWFKDRAGDAGLDYHKDGAANLSAVYRSDNPDAKTLMLGSHLDSVPNGGRFDGALGVVCALEVVRTLKDNDVKLPFHVECISFTDEEGTLIGLFGSRAITGQLDAETLQNPRGGRDRLVQAMANGGISDESILAAKRDPDGILGYLEVHIEQGTRLEQADLQVGVVTSIVGIRNMYLHFHGEAAHAGTMPVLERKDAFLGAAQFTQQARELVIEKYLPGVVNVGIVEVKPGAFNIVPAQASIAVEFRHGSDDLLDAMESDLMELAHNIALEHKLGLRIEPLSGIIPAPMDADMIGHIEAAADELGLNHTQLMSFAGHDPQAMAAIAPAAMFFVPSVNGISHNPKEYTEPEDCVNAANVLLNTVLQYAKVYAV